MFCLITSGKLSRQLFEYSLKVKVVDLNPGYLLNSFLLYHRVTLFYQFLSATENDRTEITEIFPINQNFERYNDHTYFCTQPKPNVIQVDNFQKVRFVYSGVPNKRGALITV